MKRHTLTAGYSYSRITKRYSLSSTNRHRGRTQTTAWNRLISTKKLACLTIRIRAWAMGTRPRAKTRRKRTPMTFSTQVKASLVLGFLCARHRVAARAGAAHRTFPLGPLHPAPCRQWAAAARFHAKRPQSTFHARYHRTRRTSTTKSGSIRRRYPRRRSRPCRLGFHHRSP